VNDEKEADEDNNDNDNNNGGQYPEEDEGSCNCFFLNIFCWIFQCLLSVLFK
jgi:hypothetical protein